MEDIAGAAEADMVEEDSMAAHTEVAITTADMGGIVGTEEIADGEVKVKPRAQERRRQIRLLRSLRSQVVMLQ